MNNYRKIIIFLLTLIISFSIASFDSSFLYAKRTKTEARDYLDQVEFKVVKLKENNIESHSQDIMLNINAYIADANKYYNQRKYDMAYYMAKLAEEYIELINARIKLQDAIDEYNKAKSMKGK